MNGPKTQLTLRELNFAKTRYKILQTFLELNMKKDYENITVDDICDVAEISKGTFFNYFPTKEHIYTYYGWCFCARLFVELNTEKYKKSSSCDKIKFVFDFTVKEDNKYDNQMPLFISHILRRDMNIIKEVEYTKADYIYQFPGNEVLITDSSKINLPTVGELLINLLKEGIEKKEFKPDIDVKKVVFHLLSIYFSPCIIYKFLRQEYPLEEVYTTLLDDIIEPIRNKE
ncbi:TetR/AcrR family transcriptional regulator [Sedimentibacter sp.]|uniref:TetR/AcrR family transcriptional regulator n=1 Tax=Sedimentibacter sp. TaxID=1960295 RepID=UPI0028AD8CA1|nr:TetR/AcrR family transcriptional regulator [Sedimentibacter sp.]